jgi:hypothetical protein
MPNPLTQGSLSVRVSPQGFLRRCSGQAFGKKRLRMTPFGMTPFVPPESAETRGLAQKFADS